MSTQNNTDLYLRAQEVLGGDPPKAVREVIERCLDNDDLDGLFFVLSHFPEDEDNRGDEG